MDTYPITARSLGLYFKVDGNNLERAYKDHLSGFRNWEQACHAEDWVLHSENIGKRLGIDETMLHKDMMIFLTNKEGHGKRHTLMKLEQLVKNRKYYSKKHPKKYKGKKRGRKPQRLNKRFRPTMLSNGETVIELLTRSKCLLSVSGEK